MLTGTQGCPIRQGSCCAKGMNAPRINGRILGKRMNLLCLASLTAMLLGMAVHAENSQKIPVPVRASAGELVDTRSTGSFNSECKIELKFTGDAATYAGAVRTLHVSKALAEFGR